MFSKFAALATEEKVLIVLSLLLLGSLYWMAFI